MYQPVQPQFQARNGNHQLIEPQTCIFPILRHVPTGGLRLVGTGFFITSIGHFVTAKHVILDVYDPITQTQNGTLCAMHFVEGAQVLFRNITAVSCHNGSDIAVGKMDFHVVNSSGQPLTNPVPRFTTMSPGTGRQVVTFAYPESDGLHGLDSMAEFRPKFYSGRCLSHSEKPRDRVMVSWPHYETSINVLGGASGGPVFDERGRVFGINCVGGYEDLSYMARTQELFDLVVPDFPLAVPATNSPPTVRELVKIGHIIFRPSVR